MSNIDFHLFLDLSLIGFDMGDNIDLGAYYGADLNVKLDLDWTLTWV